MLPANGVEKELKLGFSLVYDANLIFNDLKKSASLETAQQRSRLYDGKKENRRYSSIYSQDLVDIFECHQCGKHIKKYCRLSYYADTMGSLFKWNIMVVMNIW